MKELIIAIIASVSLVGILGMIQFSTFTGAQIADQSILVSGYLEDNEDNNDPMCEGDMKVIAQPGDKIIGLGRATGIKYFIKLYPGWQNYSHLGFYIYDVSPVYCTSVETKKLNATGKNIIDLRYEFKNINCMYYVEYDHIEEQEEKYWGKASYYRSQRIYR